jgi:hypothetical protein
MSGRKSAGCRQLSDAWAGSGGYHNQHLRGNNRHSPSGVWGFRRDRRKQKRGAGPCRWKPAGRSNGLFRRLVIDCDDIPWLGFVVGWGWSRNVDVGLGAEKRPVVLTESTWSTPPRRRQGDGAERSALGLFSLQKRTIKSKSKADHQSRCRSMEHSQKRVDIL